MSNSVEKDVEETAVFLANPGVKLIDVREPYEYQGGYIKGAKLLPLGIVTDEIEKNAHTKDAIVLYCRSGVRSLEAVHKLKEKGYQHVFSMSGGILAWAAAGKPIVSNSKLTPEQRDRYSRQTILPEVGIEGQEKLLEAKVLLLGAGGLGAPSALYLAAAGIGTIGIVDNDTVDLSNLQRQVIHRTDRIGMDKTLSAKKTIRELNPDVNVIIHNYRLNADNIIETIENYDLIVDGADNFPVRYLLNDASVRMDKPVVSASILSFDGQITTFIPGEGPCYRCLYPTPPPAELAPSCSQNGVLGVMAGQMGLMQANEVIKIVLGIGEVLIGRLIIYDALRTKITELKVRRDPDCPICGENQGGSPLGEFPDYEAFCGGHMSS